MFVHTFWVLLLIVGLFFLVRRLAGSPEVHPVPARALPPGNSAMEILKQRYARGEIDREKFEQMKRDLITN